MPKYKFVATGSNTNVKAGAGALYGIITGGVASATAFVVDSVSIGATPNYVTQASNTSNLAMIGVLANTSPWVTNMYGTRFQVGLTVATTSNMPITVVYD